MENSKDVEVDTHELIANLYSLIDPENWEKGDTHILIGSLKTLINLVIVLDIPTTPSFSSDGRGGITACWIGTGWYLKVDCTGFLNVHWQVRRPGGRLTFEGWGLAGYGVADAIIESIEKIQNGVYE